MARKAAKKTTKTSSKRVTPQGKAVKPRIVSGVGVSGNVGLMSGGRNRELGAAVERAMSDAVMEAYNKGLADKPEEIKKRMMAAREKVLSAARSA